MDEAVRRAMERWPGVPAVFGWLRLDRRGRWHVKNAATERFELIEHPGIVAFIGRNYARDEAGRYVFQNGPQRVYVTLEYTPYAFRLGDAADALVAHTGAPAGGIAEAVFDESGALVVATALGAGVVVDRDLPAVLEALRDARTDARVEDDVLQSAAAGRANPLVRLFGSVFTLGAARSADLPTRFGYVREPVAQPPEPRSPA